MEKNISKLKTVQWILAIIGVLIALSAFKKGIAGILGGIFIFASAFVISPLFEKTPVLMDKPKLRTVAQFAGAFLLLLLGSGITPSNRTETTTDTLETTAPTITETIPETEIPAEIETIPDTPDDELKDRQIGDSVTIYGVTVTVNSVTDSKTNSGSDAYEVNITYQNHSGKSLIINPYDWSSVLHTGSDKAHVGGDVSFHADTVSNNAEWTGVVTIWKDETTEKVKFESSSLNLGKDIEKSATWMISSDSPAEEIAETEEPEKETEAVAEVETVAEVTAEPEETIEEETEEEIIPETEIITEPPTEPENQVGKNVDELRSFTYHGNVKNDVTGNWRYAVCSDAGKNIAEYAVSYYKNYMKDEEIHAIINFADRTTTKIIAWSFDPENLDITVYSYVDGEEHDAKLMFGGTPLAYYSVNKETGEITEN